MRHGHGNRGKAFEESIIMVNNGYKNKGKAIITKVTNRMDSDSPGQEDRFSKGGA